MKRWTSPLLLAIATLFAEVAIAAPRTLAVVASVQGDQPPTTAADLERLAIEESEARPGIARFELVRRAQRCGPDPTCLASELPHAELALLIAADYRLDPPLVGISLIDLRASRVVTVTSVDLDKASLRVAVSPALSRVLEAGELPVATVFEATVDPPTAKIVVTPAPLRSEGKKLWLAPGRYEIEVVEPGFVSAKTAVTLEPGARRAVGIRLAEEETLTGPLLWGALIIGVVGAGALVTALIAGGDSRCLCVDRGSGCQDGCAPN